MSLNVLDAFVVTKEAFHIHLVSPKVKRSKISSVINVAINSVVAVQYVPTVVTQTTSLNQMSQL